jgi:mannose-1-phosphate guanylyltransferase
MAEGQIVPLILAGGFGTRLWPVSRDSMPKRFMRFAGHQSTLQRTLSLLADPALFASPIVMTANDFRLVVQQQAEEVCCECTLALEPTRHGGGDRGRFPDREAKEGESRRARPSGQLRGPGR